MTAFLFRRSLWLIPIMLAVIVTASLLLQVSPGKLISGEDQAVTGEAPALEALFAPPAGGSIWQSRAGNSLRLVALALAAAAGLGLLLAVLAGLNGNSRLAGVARALETAAISLPGFLLASLVVALAAWWRKTTGAVQGYQGLASWLLPAAVLAFGLLGYVARLLRAALRQVMAQDYALSARAKGLPERAVFTRHLLRISMISVSRLLAPALSGLVAGSFLVEAVFGFPGMGRTLALAILAGDRAVILAVVLVYAFLAALATLGADLLAAVLDPRLHREER